MLLFLFTEIMDFMKNKPAPKQEFLFSDLVSTYQEGRDELNLAEFPIAAIGYRVESAQKTIVYKDETFDKALGKLIPRKLTITASDDFGLPTATDDEVLLGLLQLTFKHGFKNRIVNFRPIELLRILGWAINGANYERLREALSRWVGVTLRYTNAWRDKSSGEWKDREFHIIDAQSFTSTVNRGNASLEGAASFTWNEVVFANFQAGNLKALDFDFYRKLKSSIAKRIFRFLDKRFYHRNGLTFDLETFAFEKIGLSRSVSIDMAQVKRRLTSAIEELERLNYIKTLPPAKRFTKRLRRGHWDVHFERWGEGEGANPTPDLPVEQVSGLESRLRSYGITPAKCRKLVSQHDSRQIEAQLEQLDFLISKGGGTAPQNAAGWLTRAIAENWTAPLGFVSQAEILEAARNEAEKARKRSEVKKCRDEARQAQEAAQRAAAAQQEAKVSRYLESLPESERLTLEKKAIMASPLATGRIGPALKKAIVQNFVTELLEGKA